MQISDPLRPPQHYRLYRSPTLVVGNGNVPNFLVRNGKNITAPIWFGLEETTCVDLSSPGFMSNNRSYPSSFCMLSKLLRIQQLSWYVIILVPTIIGCGTNDSILTIDPNRTRYCPNINYVFSYSQNPNPTTTQPEIN